MANPNPKDPKLEWMYKSSKDLLNREDYLLGRSVDKNYEILNAEEQKEMKTQLFGITVPKNHVEYECIPFSIREYRSLQNTDQVDIQRKILEDPLMAIKQKEIESRRKLLENPVKLKELHNILKMEKLRKSSKKRKSKKSKSKKKKSSSNNDRDSSDSDSEKDLDKLLAKKYKKVKGSLDEEEFNANLDFEKILNNKFEKLSKELEEMTKSKYKKSKKKRKRRKSTSESSSTSSNSDSDKALKKSSRNSKNVEPKDVRRNFITRHLNINSRTKPSSAANIDDDRLSRQNDRRSNSRSRRNVSSTNIRSNYRNNDNRSISKSRRNFNSPDGQSNSRNKEQYSIIDQRNSSRNSNTQRRRRSLSRNEENSYHRYGRSRSRNKMQNTSDSYSRNKKEFYDRNREPEFIKNSYTNDRQQNKPEIKSKNSFTGQLSEEEKIKIREQMIQHGIKRDEERTNKVREYRRNVEAEENNQNSSFDHNFANKEMKKAYKASTSIESRIKSNLNNIQRTSRAMDSNFARK